jgi:hypothetical protein
MKCICSIEEVSGSNLDWDTRYSDRKGFRDFPQFLQANAGIPFHHDKYSARPLQFINHPIL